MISLSAFLLLTATASRPSSAAEILPSSVTDAVNLRGYGRVEMGVVPGRTVFRCQDERHADILLGKLLADLFWDAPEKHKTATFSVASKEYEIHEYQPYGFLIAFRSENYVVLLGDANEEKLKIAASGDPLLRGNNFHFKPNEPYPAYLDALDLRSVRFHDSPMRSLDQNSLQSHWDFSKRFGDGGIQQSALAFWTSSPAPGVIDWSPTDFMFQQAKKNNSLVALEPQIGGILPNWVYNSDPTNRATPSPSMLIDAWGGVGATGATYESSGISKEDQAKSSFDFLKKVVQRYGKDPNLVAWMPLNGMPGGEFAYHDRVTPFFDYSDKAQEAFRNWLSTDRSQSLASLGERWYGNPSHFSSWSQVSLPDVNSFFGNPFAADSLNLNGIWQWQPVPSDRLISPTSEASVPELNEARWVPFETMPSQWSAFLPNVRCFYRKQFDATEAEAKSGKFLVVDAYVHARSPINVWINRQFAGRSATAPYEPEALRYEQISLPTGGKLKSGRNEIIIEVPSGDGNGSEGKILGPVFFTPHKPEHYPKLGPQGNARFVDLKDWQAYSYFQKDYAVFGQLRSLDADRPTILSGEAYYQLGDYEGKLAMDYGLGIENTGRESFYRPQLSGHGVVTGYYPTSEESATARSASNLESELGWMLFDADASHVFYYQIDNNIKIEKETSWFSQRSRLLNLIGKSMREKPSLLVLSDPESYRLGFEDPVMTDIGKAQLPQMHVDNGYVTASDIEQGIANGYPVIFDCGTRVMDEKLVTALTKYVEEGGTFITSGDSGRNTPTEPDAWPIDRISGFSVRPKDEQGEVLFGTNVAFAPNLNGVKFNPQDNNGISLTPTTGGSQTLATWSDGSTAIGYRELGRGRIIRLGMHDISRVKSTISDSDPLGSTTQDRILAILLQGLGVSRTSYSSNPSIWTRRLITKNGLQNWLVAINTEKTALTADVAMKVDKVPEVLIDAETGNPVPFTVSPQGWLQIRGVAFNPNSTHVFAIRRGTLLEGVHVWWSEKLKYWQERTHPIAQPELPVNITSIPVSNWSFSPGTEANLTTESKWKAGQFDESKWTPLANGPWRHLSPELEAHKGTSLYRTTINVPNEWQSHEILFNLYTYDTPISFGKTQFFLDGKQIATYNPAPGFGYSQTLNFDITKLAIPGSHVLTASVEHLPALDSVAGPFLSGAIWLSALPKFSELLDLGAGWEAIGEDWLTRTAFNAPGNVQAKYLKKTFTAPTSWSGKSVFLKVISPSPFSTVVINGTLINKTITLHQFGTKALMNVSPYLRLGGDNVIELWPIKTARNRDNSAKAQIASIQVSGVSIGPVDPGDLPVRQ